MNWSRKLTDQLWLGLVGYVSDRQNNNESLGSVGLYHLAGGHLLGLVMGCNRQIGTSGLKYIDMTIHDNFRVC